jgi:hypothetical protein
MKSFRIIAILFVLLLAFRVDYETTERRHRFTAYIEQDSLGNVLALAQSFGIASTLLPFLQ